jgi:hypothetical protein
MTVAAKVAKPYEAKLSGSCAGRHRRVKRMPLTGEEWNAVRLIMLLLN